MKWKTPHWCEKCGYRATNYDKHEWICKECGQKHVSHPFWKYFLYKIHIIQNWCDECNIPMKTYHIAKKGYLWDRYEAICPKCNHSYKYDLMSMAY